MAEEDRFLKTFQRDEISKWPDEKLRWAYLAYLVTQIAHTTDGVLGEALEKLWNQLEGACACKFGGFEVQLSSWAFLSGMKDDAIPGHVATAILSSDTLWEQGLSCSTQDHGDLQEAIALCRQTVSERDCPTKPLHTFLALGQTKLRYLDPQKWNSWYKWLCNKKGYPPSASATALLLVLLWADEHERTNTPPDEEEVQSWIQNLALNDVVVRAANDMVVELKRKKGQWAALRSGDTKLFCETKQVKLWEVDEDKLRGRLEDKFPNEAAAVAALAADLVFLTLSGIQVSRDTINHRRGCAQLLNCLEALSLRQGVQLDPKRGEGQNPRGEWKTSNIAVVDGTRIKLDCPMQVAKYLYKYAFPRPNDVTEPKHLDITAIKYFLVYGGGLGFLKCFGLEEKCSPQLINRISNIRNDICHVSMQELSRELFLQHLEQLKSIAADIKFCDTQPLQEKIMRASSDDNVVRAAVNSERTAMLESVRQVVIHATVDNQALTDFFAKSVSFLQQGVREQQRTNQILYKAPSHDVGARLAAQNKYIDQLVNTLPEGETNPLADKVEYGSILWLKSPPWSLHNAFVAELVNQVIAKTAYHSFRCGARIVDPDRTREIALKHISEQIGLPPVEKDEANQDECKAVKAMLESLSAYARGNAAQNFLVILADIEWCTDTMFSAWTWQLHLIDVPRNMCILVTSALDFPFSETFCESPVCLLGADVYPADDMPSEPVETLFHEYFVDPHYQWERLDNCDKENKFLRNLLLFGTMITSENVIKPDVLKYVVSELDKDPPDVTNNDQRAVISRLMCLDSMTLQAPLRKVAEEERELKNEGGMWNNVNGFRGDWKKHVRKLGPNSGEWVDQGRQLLVGVIEEYSKWRDGSEQVQEQEDVGEAKKAPDVESFFKTLLDHLLHLTKHTSGRECFRQVFRALKHHLPAFAGVQDQVERFPQNVPQGHDGGLDNLYFQELSEEWGSRDRLLYTCDTPRADKIVSLVKSCSGRGDVSKLHLGSLGVRIRVADDKGVAEAVQWFSSMLGCKPAVLEVDEAPEGEYVAVQAERELNMPLFAYVARYLVRLDVEGCEDALSELREIDFDAPILGAAELKPLPDGSDLVSVLVRLSWACREGAALKVREIPEDTHPDVLHVLRKWGAPLSEDQRAKSQCSLRLLFVTADGKSDIADHLIKQLEYTDLGVDCPVHVIADANPTPDQLVRVRMVVLEVTDGFCDSENWARWFNYCLENGIPLVPVVTHIQILVKTRILVTGAMSFAEGDPDKLSGKMSFDDRRVGASLLSSVPPKLKECAAPVYGWIDGSRYDAKDAALALSEMAKWQIPRLLINQGLLCHKSSEACIACSEKNAEWSLGCGCPTGGFCSKDFVQAASREVVGGLATRCSCGRRGDVLSTIPRSNVPLVDIEHEFLQPEDHVSRFHEAESREAQEYHLDCAMYQAWTQEQPVSLGEISKLRLQWAGSDEETESACALANHVINHIPLSDTHLKSLWFDLINAVGSKWREIGKLHKAKQFFGDLCTRYTKYGDDDDGDDFAFTEKQLAVLRGNLAGVEFELGELTEAKRHHVKALDMIRSTGGSIEVECMQLLGLAKCEVELGNMQGARSNLDAAKVKSLGDHSPTIERTLLETEGLLHLYSGSYSAAMSSLSRALDDTPDGPASFRLKFLLADVHLALGHPVEAHHVLEDIGEYVGGDKFRILSARVALCREQFGKCIDLLDRVASDNPNRYRWLACAHLASKNIVKARQMIGQCKERRSDFKPHDFASVLHLEGLVLYHSEEECFWEPLTMAQEVLRNCQVVDRAAIAQISVDLARLALEINHTESISYYHSAARDVEKLDERHYAKRDLVSKLEHIALQLGLLGLSESKTEGKGKHVVNTNDMTTVECQSTTTDTTEVDIPTVEDPSIPADGITMDKQSTPAEANELDLLQVSLSANAACSGAVFADPVSLSVTLRPPRAKRCLCGNIPPTYQEVDGQAFCSRGLGCTARCHYCEAVLKGGKYVERGGHRSCVEDCRCPRCWKGVKEGFIHSKTKRHWHHKCFRCDGCGNEIEKSYRTIDGKNYCPSTVECEGCCADCHRPFVNDKWTWKDRKRVCPGNQNCSGRSGGSHRPSSGPISSDDDLHKKLSELSQLVAGAKANLSNQNSSGRGGGSSGSNPREGLKCDGCGNNLEKGYRTTIDDKKFCPSTVECAGCCAHCHRPFVNNKWIWKERKRVCPGCFGRSGKASAGGSPRSPPGSSGSNPREGLKGEHDDLLKKLQELISQKDNQSDDLLKKLQELISQKDNQSDDLLKKLQELISQKDNQSDGGV